MKNQSRAIATLSTIALIVLAGTATVAQNRERFGISAKAGGVNAVLGRVMVTRKGQDPQLLTNQDDLVSGDTVTTGSLSHIEVLLNPGTYLRIGEQSEFQLKDGSLENLQIRLLKGSAIVEATGVSDMDLQIQVVTPEATFTIIRSGVYRINVQRGVTELAVRKGRASFGPNRDDIIKGGNKVTFMNGAIARAKVDKNKDEFEVWSKARAELLAGANSRLSPRALNGYLATFNDWDSPYWGSGWGATRRRWGLWTFSARAGCYTFLPFFYGWSSPYGHYYGNYWGNYYGPGSYGPNWNGQPIVNNQPNPGSGTPGGTPSGGRPTGGGPAPGPAPMPRLRDSEGDPIIRKSMQP